MKVQIYILISFFMIILSFLYPKLGDAEDFISTLAVEKEGIKGVDVFDRSNAISHTEEDGKVLKGTLTKGRQSKFNNNDNNDNNDNVEEEEEEEEEDFGC